MRRHGSTFTLLLLMSGAASLTFVLLGARSHGKATAEGNGHSTLAAAAISDDLTSCDLDRGRQLFMTTCASCHGAAGRGLPHQGADLRTSKFVAGHDDDQLVSFLRSGRKPDDPNTTQGLLMPPRGGNPQLDDDALRDIVAYLRAVQK